MDDTVVHREVHEIEPARFARYRTIWGKLMKELQDPAELNDFSGVILFSTAWCAPCKVYKPLLSATCADLDMPFLVVDAEKHRDLAIAWQVRMVPTTIRLINGQETKRRQGAQTAQALQSLLSFGET